MMTEKAYMPSEVLLKLLYKHLNYEIQVSEKSKLIEFAQKQFRFAFSSTLFSIREWKIMSFVKTEGSEFWIVDSYCSIRTDFLNELERRVIAGGGASSQLIKDNFTSERFRQRLGEEIYCWYLKNPADAKAMGLKKDKYDRISLVRKNV